jgi:hypothetical protein
LNFGVCFFQYEEESVKLEPELVGLAPLLMKNNEEAASIQSVLHQLHAIQRERINIMEKEEKEKVATVDILATEPAPQKFLLAQSSACDPEEKSTRCGIRDKNRLVTDLYQSMLICKISTKISQKLGVGTVSVTVLMFLPKADEYHKCMWLVLHL